MSDGPQSVGVMLGKGCTLHALGKTWKVSAPDLNAKERLEKLVASAALAEVRRLRDTLDPAAYQEAFSEVTRSLKSYRTWGAGWQRVVFDPANVHLFLWSLLLDAHPDVTEEAVFAILGGTPEEVAAAYAQVMPDFFTMLLAPVRDRIPADKLAEMEAMIAGVPEQIRRTIPINS